MLNLSATLKNIWKPAPQPEPELEETILYVGDVVVTIDGRLGIIEKIAISPYYWEEIEGIERAYVSGLNREYGDWLLADEMALVGEF